MKITTHLMLLCAMEKLTSNNEINYQIAHDNSMCEKNRKFKLVLYF